MKLTDNAIEVLNKRYLRKDDEGNVIETPDEMFWRVAKYIASAEKISNQPSWAKKFCEIMTNLEFLPNSPTLRNAGANSGSFSACFYLDIQDSRESIFDVLKKSVEIQAFGGGTGHNFSNLRPEGALIKSTKGRSSGPIGFMKVFDFVVGEVIQQGGVRHGAQMGILNIDHPDIEKFIICKQEEGKLNNFNISVAITDEFMKDKLLSKYPFLYWDLKFGDKHNKTINGQELWNKIIEGAWKNGEPGIVFIDTMNNNSQTKGYQTITGTNPCGEQPLGNLESCNLGSINLSKFVRQSEAVAPNKPSYYRMFDWDYLKKVIQIAVRFLDDVIDVNNYPILEIEKETKKFRKIGLGVMGWADALIKMGISYNSQEALELAEKVMKFINETAIKYSEELYREKGPMEFFKKPELEHLENPLAQRRNATLTTIAPTGTLSLIATCSSGIEPIYAFEFKKKCLDGEITVKHPLLEKWLSQHHVSAYPYKPDYFVESKDVPIGQHVRMQAAFQKYTHNAVSKTINAPFETTMEEVDRAFRLAYELECKGITFYRQGSRDDEAQTDLGIKELSPENITKAREAIKRLSTKFQAAPGSRETPEHLLGERYKIKTAEGNLWVHLFEDEKTGFKEVWCSISKSGRTIAAMTDALGRVCTLALRSGSTWEDLEKQLRGIIGETTVWHNGEQILSVPDALAKIIRKRYLDRENIESEKIPQPARSQKVVDRSKMNIIREKLCPDCGGIIIHDEGCRGGRCQSCGWSNCK